MGAQHPDRAMRRASQPDAGAPWARDLASLARGGGCRWAAANQDHARTLPVGEDDMLAGQHPRGHVKNNDPSLIEPAPLHLGSRIASGLCQASARPPGVSSAIDGPRDRPYELALPLILLPKRLFADQVTVLGYQAPLR